jgi:predicted nucleic acid-binding protein
MTKSNILLDASVVLELFLLRPKFEIAKSKLLEYETKFITPITLGILFYYAEREKLEIKRAEKFANNCEILNMDQETYNFALKIYKQSDLEDAMQVSCGIQNSIDTVITLDKKMYKKYSELIDIILL